jgi:hypothetical protein
MLLVYSIKSLRVNHSHSFEILLFSVAENRAFFKPKLQDKKLGTQIKLIYDSDISNKRRNVDFKTRHHDNGFSDFFILDNSLR